MRRRYRAVRQHQRQRSTTSSDPHDSGYETTNNVNLSMHLPAQHNGNRFDAIRPRTPPQVSNEHRMSSLDRRSRHIRNARDERKRREARRNRNRRDLAQMLDEQLSRDIDRTLQQANIQRPLPVRSPPRPLLTFDMPPSPPSYSSRVPHAPPQLPLLNFGGLDLMDDFPPLTPIKNYPTPRAPSPMLPSVPSWCPPLPSFNNVNLKFSEYPLFFDISKLPEPTPTSRSETTYQELQIWRPLQSPQPKKHSRYFPPPAQPKPSVKLPPTRCTLHASDEGSQDVQAATRDIVERAIGAAQTRRDEAANASAANLWRILTSPDLQPRYTSDDPYLNSFAYKPVEDVFTAPYEQYDHRSEAIGAQPAELESGDLPFVHANSLTGHANERGSDPLPAEAPEEPKVFIFDTRTGDLPIERSSYGLNELIVDHEYDIEALPPLPSTPALEEAESGSVITSPSRRQSVTPEDDRPPATPDAQYNSQMALFELDSAITTAADDDMVDVATFLAMGHGSSCWCTDCEDETPELVDFSSADDEGWVDYSTENTVVSPSDDEEWEWEWDSPMVEIKSTSTQTEWDDSFAPLPPSSVAHGAW